MNMFFLLFLLFFLILVFVKSMKKTIFSFSLKDSSFAGVFIIKEIFLLVILGVFLFEYYGVEYFTTFYMTTQSLHETSFYIFYAVFLLFISIGFFSKFIFNKSLVLSRDKPLSHNIYFKYILAAIIFTMFFIILVFYYFGVKHAFLYGLFSNNSLMEIRLNNRYSGVPTVLLSFYGFLNILLAILVGFCLRVMPKKVAVALFLIIVFFASYLGGKGPLLNAILILIFSYASSKESLKLNVKLVFKSILILILFFIAVYFVSKVQFPGLTPSKFFSFIINRLGIGQIHGVYEQFALKLSDSKYIYHTIPFANYFFDYVPYNKDLMLHTWGRNSVVSETGVMNSLFIGEALAIGGKPLVILSPVIVAFNYCIVASFLVFSFNKMFLFSMLHSQKISALLVVSFISFTGDITGLLFFKSLVMIAIFISPLYLIFYFLKTLSVKA